MPDIQLATSITYAHFSDFTLIVQRLHRFAFVASPVIRSASTSISSDSCGFLSEQTARTSTFAVRKVNAVTFQLLDHREMILTDSLEFVSLILVWVAPFE